jgi:hypothetical protein
MVEITKNDSLYSAEPSAPNLYANMLCTLSLGSIRGNRETCFFFE